MANRAQMLGVAGAATLAVVFSPVSAQEPTSLASASLGTDQIETLRAADNYSAENPEMVFVISGYAHNSNGEILTNKYLQNKLAQILQGEPYFLSPDEFEIYGCLENRYGSTAAVYVNGTAIESDGLGKVIKSLPVLVPDYREDRAKRTASNNDTLNREDFS